MKPQLSVVVPTLDEAMVVPALIRALRSQQAIELELIIADASPDETTAQACRSLGARVLRTPRGRGRQMNAGAAASHADSLLFLHADSRPTHPRQLRRALDCLNAGIAAVGDTRVAGHFPLRFLRSRSGYGRLFRFIEAKSASNRPGTVNGDQGLLIRRDYFEALGGFDTHLPYLEDQRIAAHIFAQGRWLLLPDALGTSARRFEAGGHYRVYALMALIQVMNEAGVDGFFEPAAGLYAAQSELQRIELRSYLRAAAEAIASHPRRLELARRIARSLGGNAWQINLLMSVLRP